MSNKLFNFVEESFYINLDHRKDKKELLEDHFEKIGILKYVKRSKAFYPSDLGFKLLENGKYNPMDYTTCCFYSQLQVIKYAKEKKLNNVLIFEDDVEFYTKGGYDPLEEISNGLEQIAKFNDWDVCYLGADLGENIEELNLVSPNLIKLTPGKTSNPACCFAMIVRNTIYEDIIDAFENRNERMIDLYISANIKGKYLIHRPAIFQRYGIMNDIGPNNYIGQPTETWLKRRDKKINYLF
jgi:GR25 family glycosyltransferase involved in LPS biosynthesis